MTGVISNGKKNLLALVHVKSSLHSCGGVAETRVRVTPRVRVRVRVRVRARVRVRVRVTVKKAYCH